MAALNIKDYCVKVKGTSLELRKRLLQCLKDNNQDIYARTKLVISEEMPNYSFRFDGTDWSLDDKPMGLKEVTIEEFLELFEVTKQTEPTASSKCQIGDVFENSTGTPCKIIAYNPTSKMYTYTSGKNGMSYTTTERNITSNWKLVSKSDAPTEASIFNNTISNLQPGDKVRVRPDLDTATAYSMFFQDRRDEATTEMIKLQGKIVTIEEIKEGKYGVEGSPYYWTDEMFSEIIIEERTSKFKVGDLVELIDNYEVAAKYNDVTLRDSMIRSIKPGKSKVTSVYYLNNEPVVTISTGYRYGEDCLKLYEPKTEESPTRKDLAFYKESKEPWTEEELNNVRNYCGDYSSRFEMTASTATRKYAYWADDYLLKVYLWDNQNIAELGLTEVSYESVFCKSSVKLIDKQLKERKSIQKEQEKTRLTKKEETFMSKLKTTALITADQNKEAAIIATKMEAGRVINKQVIKQVKPHVPMLLRGYLDTPLAPVILANAAAILGNHTNNSKVQKVSELMLLAAADTTVQSFNLDKIIDDILAGIKLPAGILDDAE